LKTVKLTLCTGWSQTNHSFGFVVVVVIVVVGVGILIVLGCDNSIQINEVIFL